MFFCGNKFVGKHVEDRLNYFLETFSVMQKIKVFLLLNFYIFVSTWILLSSFIYKWPYDVLQMVAMVIESLHKFDVI